MGQMENLAVEVSETPLVTKAHLQEFWQPPAEPQTFLAVQESENHKYFKMKQSRHNNTPKKTA
jgi:hypothetical protein